MALTGDIEVYETNQAQPVLKQDYTKKTLTKKLGLRGNSNKFNPPSGGGLLPTPSLESLPGPFGLSSHPPFTSPVSSSISKVLAPNTPNTTIPSLTLNSSAPPLPPSLLPTPITSSTPAIPRAPSNLYPPFAPPTSHRLHIEPRPLPIPQTFVADLARHYGSLPYHKNKEAFFSHSMDSGYYPSFTLPRLNSDLTKGLSHHLTVQYHEAVATLRRKVCETMRDHQWILQQEESLRISTMIQNLNGLYEQDVVCIICKNAKRTANNRNNNNNRRNNRQ